MILGLACLTVLFVNAEPLTLIKRYLGFKEEKIGQINCDGSKKHPIRDFFTKLIYCSMCSGVYFGIVTMDIYDAAIVSILATFIDKKLRS